MHMVAAQAPTTQPVAPDVAASLVGGVVIQTPPDATSLVGVPRDVVNVAAPMVSGELASELVARITARAVACVLADADVVRLLAATA